MRYILINMFVSFFYSIILLCIKVYAEHNTIKILMEMPDTSKVQYSDQQLSQINNYFLTLNSNSTELKNINVEFSYYDHKKNTNEDYPKYLKYLEYVIEQLGSSNPTYDMMILDDRFLFSDISMIENSLIENFLKSRKLHKKFRDLTDYIKPEDVKHHDEKILNDAYYENRLYGLPYELDFDVLYYSNNDTDITNNTPSLGNITWDDLLSTKSSMNTTVIPLSIALGNDDEFLNFFIEYFNNYYNILEETRILDPDYFNIFYNETSETVYKSFQKFLDKCSKSNINQALKTNMEDTFNSFLKKERTFFKGRASYYSFQDENITFELPPMDYSVINEKYLVLNPKSSIKPEILVKAALQLTSREMQFFRAEQLGMIPTVDFFKDENDLSSYCLTYPEVCKIVRKIKQIRIKDIFKVNAYSAQFMEIRLSLPMIMDKFLRENDVEYLKRGFRNIVEVKMINYKNTHNPSTIILYILMVICAIFSIIIMIKVFKYRNHPYLKLISPHFSIIIIFGFMLSIFTPLSNIQNNSIQRCKFNYIYENLCDNLILFPMLVVTFRIYCIYTNQSKVNFGKKLSNHRLLIFVFILLLLVVINCTFTVFTKEFFISTSGNIRTQRYPVCNHEDSTLHIIIEIIYESSIFISIIVMVKKSGKASKKYDEIKFIYAILLILFVDYLLSTFFIYIESTTLFMILCDVYVLSCVICIYLLVGSRLLYIAKHPQQDLSESNGPYQNYFNIINIADFIPVIEEEEKKSTNSSNKKKSKSSNKNSRSDLNLNNNDSNDPIANNPNNIFFNQGLALLNKQNEKVEYPYKI